jgi:hypothetical protein
VLVLAVGDQLVVASGADLVDEIRVGQRGAVDGGDVEFAAFVSVDEGL